MAAEKGAGADNGFEQYNFKNYSSNVFRYLNADPDKAMDDDILNNYEKSITEDLLSSKLKKVSAHDIDVAIALVKKRQNCYSSLLKESLVDLGNAEQTASRGKIGDLFWQCDEILKLLEKYKKDTQTVHGNTHHHTKELQETVSSGSHKKSQKRQHDVISQKASPKGKDKGNNKEEHPIKKKAEGEVTSPSKEAPRQEKVGKKPDSDRTKNRKEKPNDGLDRQNMKPEDLVLKKGLVLEKGTNKPFTGKLASPADFYKDGSTYIGELKDGYREGEGTYKTEKGTVYTGHWTGGGYDQEVAGKTGRSERELGELDELKNVTVDDAGNTIKGFDASTMELAVSIDKGKTYGTYSLMPPDLS